MRTHPVAGRRALAAERRASAPSAISNRAVGTRNRVRRPPNGYLRSPEASKVRITGPKNRNRRSGDLRNMETQPNMKTRPARPANSRPAEVLKNPKKLSTNHLKSATDRGGSGMKF